MALGKYAEFPLNTLLNTSSNCFLFVQSTAGTEYKVQSIGCGVQGTEYRVQSTGYIVRVQSTGNRVQGAEYRVQSTVYRV